MVDLTDFNKPTDNPDVNPLATFAGGGTLDAQRKPVNQDTITNIAAHAAVLSDPEKVLPTYSAVSNELSTSSKSPTLDTLANTRQQADDAANLSTVQKAMSDPNMSVEDKTKLLSGYTAVQNMPVQKSLGAQVTTQAAIASSSPTDNDETNFTRVDVVKNMDQVDAYNGWVSQQANNIRRMRIQNGFDSTVDVLETLVPFMSAGSQAQINAALANPDPVAKATAIAKSMALLGETKKGLADAVSAMPVDQRMQFAQKLVDLVHSSNGSITTRPNELNMISDLQDALVSGNYSNTQRIVDNISSLLDLTLIAGPAWKGAEGFLKGVAGIGKATSNAADVARADEAINRLGATTQEAVQTAKEASQPAQATGVAEGVPEVFQTPPEAMPRPEPVPTKPSVFEPQTQPPIPSGKINPQVQNETDFQKAYSQVKDVGDLPAGGEVGNQASFEKAYGDVKNVGDLPATGEVGNQASFEKAYGNVTDVGNLPATGEVANQDAFEKAYSASHPITEDTAAATRQIILDNIHKELTDLGAPSSVIEDAKAAVAKKITSVSLNDPTLPKQITDSMRGIFRRAGASGIDPTALKRIREYVDAQSTVERRTVRTDVDFGSVSQRVSAVNPGKARAMLDAVVADDSGTLAKALYGTTKEEAIANDVLPEIAEEGGTVRGKYSTVDDSGPSPDQAFIRDQKKVRGDIHFSTAEKSAMRNTVASDLDSVVGLTPRREMMTIGSEPYTPKFESTPSGVTFDQVFGPKDGGFANAKQAADQVKFALKKYGVTDKEIEVIGRDAQGNFSPVKITDAPGEYLVRVKHDYQFSPADTQSWALYGPNKFWKMFDALPAATNGKAGGLFEHLIPPVNINDSLLTRAASNASDQAARIYKGLEQLGKDYASKYVKLNTYEKNLVTRYIMRANAEGIPFNPIAMKGTGFSDDAIEAVRLWKRAQDTNWHFENIDLNKTLHNLGWQRYVDQTGNSDLIVRPVGKGAISQGDKVMDGAGRLTKLSDKDLTKLYESGGTLAQLRRPIEKDGDLVEHIIVKNNAEDSYLRRIREDDPTLAYRDGYYAVKYKDPYFITKNIVGQNGKSVSKAVATAGSRKEADDLLARLKATDAKSEYNIRGDVKKNPTELDDFKWDQIVNSGRSPQRIRGERLVNADPTVTDLAHASVESPEESLVASIRSLSNRMAMRDYLDAAKQRWLSQFSHTLKGQDVQGFPDDVRMIGGRTKLAKAGDVASARVTWRYINAMESGYVNLIDDVSKSFFNFMSDTAGTSKSMAWAEKPLRNMGEVGPASFGRKKVFRMTLAANPLRQAPIQAAQAIHTMLATNPLAIPKVAAQLVMLHGFRRGLNPADMGIWHTLTGLDGKAAQQLFEHWKMAGFENAVDANSLIRDDLTKLTDRSIGQKIKSVAAVPLDIGQKFGFQVGENALMDTMWLSEYDRLKKSGQAINAESLGIMNARIRDLTGNMNRAGELPYNENSLSLVMQFAQASHKALATILFGHKGLSQMDRIKLGTASILTWGIGADATNFATSLIDNVVPDNWPGKDELKNGFFDLILNTTLSNLFHQDVHVDFADSLRQVQFPNLFQFWQGMQQSNPGKVIQSMPAGSLIGRMGNVVRELARPFTSSSDRSPEQAAVIAKSFLSLFSGVSNFYKAQYIMEHNKIMTSTGNTVDYHSNYIEGLARYAGFSSMAELQTYAFDNNRYQMSQDALNDVTQFIDTTSRHLALKDISAQDTQYYLDMLGEAQLHYKNDPFYMRLFEQRLSYKASQNDYSIYNAVQKLIGFKSKSDIQALVDNSPLTDAQKTSLLNAAEAAEGNYTNGS